MVLLMLCVLDVIAFANQQWWAFALISFLIAIIAIVASTDRY